MPDSENSRKLRSAGMRVMAMVCAGGVVFPWIVMQVNPVGARIADGGWNSIILLFLCPGFLAVLFAGLLKGTFKQPAWTVWQFRLGGIATIIALLAVCWAFTRPLAHRIAHFKSLYSALGAVDHVVPAGEASRLQPLASVPSIRGLIAFQGGPAQFLVRETTPLRRLPEGFTVSAEVGRTPVTWNFDIVTPQGMPMHTPTIGFDLTPGALPESEAVRLVGKLVGVRASYPIPDGDRHYVNGTDPVESREFRLLILSKQDYLHYTAALQQDGAPMSALLAVSVLAIFGLIRLLLPGEF